MKKYISAIGIILLTILSYHILNAHGGEDHGENKKSDNSIMSDIAEVLKETQFLFSIKTEISKKTDTKDITGLLGTVIPSSKGMMQILAPQSGKITSLKVTVGQKVKAGEVLAFMEQNLTAPEQIQLATERAGVYAEYDAAKKEYERLKSIQDIVAQKDLVNAEIRYKRAIEGKRIFDNLSGGNTNQISLIAPISGIVDNFTLAPGSTVQAGDVVFRVADINKVWVEAQVFEQDREKIQKDNKYIIESSLKEYFTEKVTFVSMSQIVNSNNQSMKVILEIDNSDKYFKPGQFVNIKVSTNVASLNNVIRVRTSALSEIGGKPVVFTHPEPEIFKLNYVSPGIAEGEYTVIEKGLAENERVVVSGAYQLKSIFLNR